MRTHVSPMYGHIRRHPGRTRKPFRKGWNSLNSWAGRMSGSILLPHANQQQPTTIESPKERTPVGPITSEGICYNKSVGTPQNVIVHWLSFKQRAPSKTITSKKTKTLPPTHPPTHTHIQLSLAASDQDPLLRTAKSPGSRSPAAPAAPALARAPAPGDGSSRMDGWLLALVAF